MGRGHVNAPIALHGYTYHAKKVCPDGSRFVYCSERKRKNCTVYGHLRPNGELSTKGEHTHEPDPDSVLIQQRRHELRELARNGSQPKSAFTQARAGLTDQDRDLLGSDDKLRSVFRRARPKDADSCVADTTPYSIQGKFAETEGGEQFLYFDSGSEDAKRMVIFASDAQLQMLSQSERITFDSSFASAPEPYGSMFTIHCEVGDRFHLAVAALFRDGPDTRTHEDYERVLAEIVKHPLLATWTPIEAHADFEEASRQAFNRFFPELKIRLCLFHHNQSLLKKVRSFEERFLNGKNTECYHRLRVLPYLDPASIERALLEIEQDAPEPCQTLIEFVRETYVGNQNSPPRFLPTEWSIYEWIVAGKPRTNESQESFHAQFNEAANADKLAVRRVRMSKIIAILKAEEENARQFCSGATIEAPFSKWSRKTAADIAIITALSSILPHLQVLDAIIDETRT
ncbi:hypothetical protein PMAYCL1PPCAC_31906 [Pristionchus mayeri]|uniref:MULE transposase domain-containing protein n=1 Tax=Pristionchus mayeri TaxID=1317129 RepID=A0AAN5IFV1_9BILA|nr:hypothetical protein PMAYCL1PPCAC_31906 [Pristionchus mayeri]